MRRKMVFLIVFALLANLQAVDTAAQEPLTLTVPLPLTGPLALFGEIEKRSYELAMEEINAEGGIEHRRVVLKFEDSKDKPDISRSIVEKLIDVKKQPVIFGEYSSACSKALAELAERKKVPYLVVSGAADEITQKRYAYVFRMIPPTAYYASGLMSFLKEIVKPSTIAIIHEDSEFGSSGGEDAARQAEKAGFTVLLKDHYARQTIDYVQYDVTFVPDLKTILMKLKAADPDLIYMVSYETDAVLLIQEIKKLGITPKLYVGAGAGFAVPEFIRDAKEAADYIVTTTLWSPRTGYPGAKRFAEKYRKLFGNYPSYHGAEAYAALYVIKDVLERARTWRSEDIRQAMKATDMMTAFGPVRFEDKEGYTNQNFMNTLVMQVIKGKYEVIWPERFASKKYVYPLPTW